MPIYTSAALKELQATPEQRKANYKAVQKYNFFQKMIDANNAFAESQQSPQLEQMGAYYKGAGEIGKNVGETLLKGAGVGINAADGFVEGYEKAVMNLDETPYGEAFLGLGINLGEDVTGILIGENAGMSIDLLSRRLYNKGADELTKQQMKRIMGYIYAVTNPA